MPLLKLAGEEVEEARSVVPGRMQECVLVLQRCHSSSDKITKYLSNNQTNSANGNSNTAVPILGFSHL